VKPPRSTTISSFVTRALTEEVVGKSKLATAVLDSASAYELTPRETELAACALLGFPREQLVDELDISQNTLKRQVRSLLRKCGQPSLDKLVIHMLHATLRLDHPGHPHYRSTARAPQPASHA
jgi:FixJ family two-component response regulator